MATISGKFGTQIDERYDILQTNVLELHQRKCLFIKMSFYTDLHFDLAALTEYN